MLAGDLLNRMLRPATKKYPPQVYDVHSLLDRSPPVVN